MTLLYHGIPDSSLLTNLNRWLDQGQARVWWFFIEFKQNLVNDIRPENSILVDPDDIMSCEINEFGLCHVLVFF